MFDIATTRWLALTDHPPIAIFLLLTGMNMVGALLIGTTPGAHSPVLIDAPSTGAACAGVASAVTAP